MNDDFPSWVMKNQEEYKALERERAALHNSFVPLAMCQYLTGAGILMFVGVTFFHSESPFYAGVGMTLAVIFGSRWWWIQLEANRILKRKIQIEDQAMAGGFSLSYNGDIRAVSTETAVTNGSDYDLSEVPAAPLPAEAPPPAKQGRPQFTQEEINLQKRNRKPWLNERP